MRQDAVLPGGIEIDGTRRRDAVFRPVTGHIEKHIGDIHRHTAIASAKVTDTLVTCLESIGGKPADKTLVEELCVADRQFLMLCLSVRLKGRQYWIHPVCAACNATFDLLIDKLALPVESAGDRFPRTNVNINGRSFSLRTPAGRDQAELSQLEDDAALKHLLLCCIEKIDGQVPEKVIIDSLNETDIAEIESVLEEISPTVCARVETECPECNQRQIVDLDLDDLSGSYSSDSLMMDIHRIAGHYHWSENEILALPSSRRQDYLRLIDNSEGRYS